MPGRGLDRELERYLVPGERVVAVVRQHWFSMARPIAAVVALLFLAVFVEAEAPQTRGGATLANFFWYAVLVAFAYLLWRYLNWRRDWFIATDKRFLLFYGFIRRKVAMMPLAKVTDMTFDRSVIGRIVGYGAFLMESAGQDQALSKIEYVPNADRHYRAICTVLFSTADPDDTLGGGRSDDGDWDDGWDDDDDDGPSGGDWPSHVHHPPGHSHNTLSERLTRWGRGESGSRAGGIPDPFEDDRGTRAEAEVLYQSEDQVRAARLADTGELPVVRSFAHHPTGTRGMARWEVRDRPDRPSDRPDRADRPDRRRNRRSLP